MSRNISSNSISRLSNTLMNFIFIIYSALCLMPILVVLSVSLSDETSVLLQGYSFLPRKLTTFAYEFIFKDASIILNAYILTVGITIIGTILSVIVIAFFAYPLSRNDLKYRKFFTFYMFTTMLFSGGLVPWYIVCSQVLHIVDTYYALFVPYLFNAWYVIILRTFYKTTIPDSLIESARIDGASELRIFFQIVSPLSKPGYATIGLFCTLAFWNDWWLSMILTTDKKLQMLQYFIYKILTEAEVLNKMATISGMSSTNLMKEIPMETARFAMCVVALGPIVLAYPFFQKYFIKGLTIGAVKG